MAEMTHPNPSLQGRGRIEAISESESETKLAEAPSPSLQDGVGGVFTL